MVVFRSYSMHRPHAEVTRNAKSIIFFAKKHHMTKRLFILFLLLCLVPLAVSGLTTMSSGDVTIGQAIDDDVLASGATVTVNAPVGSIMAVGGSVTVNAPIQGDVIATGGQVTINSNVGGKVVAAGGTVNINGKVSKNVVLAGQYVTLGRQCIVGRDALLYGGNVVNSGVVTGMISVYSKTFTNEGSAGAVYMELHKGILGTLLSLFWFFFAIGLLILGLILIRIAPKRFEAVEKELNMSPFLAVIAGFIAIGVGFFIVLILAVTMVLLPLALFLGFIGGLALLLSTLFASAVLGKRLGMLLKKDFSPYVTFLIGFVVLNILYQIPVAGNFFLVIAVSIGFGGVLLVVLHNRFEICGSLPA